MSSIPQIPWFVRWGIDIAIFAIPITTIYNYPKLIFHLGDKKKRLGRRKSFDEVQLRTSPVFDQEYVQKFTKDNRFQA